MRPPSPCRPYPTSPKDACRAGRRTGEAASAAGQYPQCPGSIGPSGAAIVLPGLRRWTPPYPQCPRRTHLEPAAQLRRRLQRWGDTAVPGVGEAIRGRDRIGSAPALRPLPHPVIPAVPQKDAPGAGSGVARRLRPGCAASTMPRSGAPSGAEIVLDRAPTVGRPHHPGHTRSAPDEGRALECGSAGRQGRGRRSVRRDGICGGGERDLRAAGALPYAGCPGSFRAAGGGTDSVPVRRMTLGEALAGLGPDPRCPSCAWRSGRLEFVAALPPAVSCTVRPSNVAIRRSRSDEPDRRFGWAHTYRG